MTAKDAIDRVCSALRQRSSLVLTTHRDPDGDGLGSEAALAEALTSLGKRVTVVNSDPVPARYRFLAGADAFLTYDPVKHRDLFSSVEALVLLDAALPGRTGAMEDALSAFGGTTIVIDHHQVGGWAAVDLIDARVSATAELVYVVIQALGVPLTQTMAEALYTGLAFDTQNFSTASTTSRVW